MRDALAQCRHVAPLGVLRERTADAHEDLDRALAGPGGAVTDLPSYARLVDVLHALHRTAEAGLTRWVAETPWVAALLDGHRLPDRSALYEADLAALGGAGSGPSDGRLATTVSGVASLYLLAGSTKGARVLLRGLPPGVAPHARAGLTDAAAPDGVGLWRAAVEVLTVPQPDHVVEAAAVEARAAFTALHQRAEAWQ